MIGLLVLAAEATAQGGAGRTLEIGRLRLTDAPAKSAETACLWRDATTGDIRIGPCGTVTSVGLSLPGIFSVSGSPVMTSGTLTATLATQTGWHVWRVPDGSTAAPAFGVLAKGHQVATTAYRDDHIVPTAGYTYEVGALATKYLAGHFAELRVGTLVAADTMATTGGRWLVGPTTQLIAALTDSATTIDVKHNNLRSGDRVFLEAAGLFEMLAVTSGPTTITGGFRYSVTRNLDATGANTWTAGDAVFAGAAQPGEGFVSAFADRSALGQGYAGHTVGRLPAHYWRFGSSGTVSTPAVGAITLPLTARGIWGSGWATGDAGGSLYRDSTVSADVAATQTNINATLDGTKSITVAFFLAKGGGSSIPTAATIVRTGATSDATAGWRVDSDFTTATSLRLTVGNGTSRQALVATSALANDGVWRHYVAVIDRESGALRLYVNGALANSAALSISGDFSSTADALDVLSMDQTNLDELTIWNRVLTAADVTALYTARTSVLSTTAAGPTVEGLVRTGSDPAAVSTRWAVGNLLGRCGYTTSTYGLLAGDCANTWVSMDATYGFRVMHGADAKLTADTSGNLSLVGDLTVATPGRLLAGGGAVEVSAGGIAINTTTTESSFNAYKFASSNAGAHGLYGYYGSNTKGTQIWSESSGTSQSAVVALGARGRDSGGVVSAVSATLTGAAVPADASIEFTVQTSALRVLPDGVQAQGTALFPFGTNATSLGTSSRRWSAFYLTDASTSEQSAIYPVVIDTGNNHRVSVVTDGAQGTTTCSGGQRISAITIRRGLVISVTCS